MGSTSGEVTEISRVNEVKQRFRHQYPHIGGSGSGSGSLMNGDRSMRYFGIDTLSTETMIRSEVFVIDDEALWLLSIVG